MLEKERERAFEKANFLNGNTSLQIDSGDRQGSPSKKDIQSKYKQELDRQRQIQAEMQSYGNMTKAEKAMNRDGLIAYKHFDGQQYAMIPGISPQKQFMDRTKYQFATHKKPSLTMTENQERLT